MIAKIHFIRHVNLDFSQEKYIWLQKLKYSILTLCICSSLNCGKEYEIWKVYISVVCNKKEKFAETFLGRFK